MPYFSFLDPMLDLDFSERMLNDIDNLVTQKTKDIETEFNNWKKKNKDQKEGEEEWYQAQEDYYADEWFFIQELKRNLLNGLAVTINTVFERHISLFVREMCKTIPSLIYSDKHTYRMDEFQKILLKANHPNRSQIPSQIFEKLRTYSEIRNCIVHREGSVPEDYILVRSFVTSNEKLFVLDKQLWKIAVTGDYIQEVLSDLKKFFHILAYKKDGHVIFY